MGVPRRAGEATSCSRPPVAGLARPGSRCALAPDLTEAGYRPCYSTRTHGPGTVTRSCLASVRVDRRHLAHTASHRKIELDAVTDDGLP